MTNINIDKEKTIVSLLGCEIDESEIIEGEKKPSIYRGKRDVGSLVIDNLSNGSFMNQVNIDYDDVYICDWVCRMFPYNNFRVGGYSCTLNLFDLPSDRLSISKDDFSLGFGLFDFTDSSERKKAGSKYCNHTSYGFYLHCKSNKIDQILVLSNMEKDPSHEIKKYAYFDRYKRIGTRVTSSIDDNNILHIERKNGNNVEKIDSNQSFETIVKDDVEGMKFFNEMRDLLNNIFPCEDVLSTLISNDEIEKYGLSVYIEPKQKKRNRTRRKK